MQLQYTISCDVLVKLSPLSLTAALPRRAPTPSGAVMWQEARKHERKLRGMMVDYKRRGERRREYYEKIVIEDPRLPL